MYIVWQEMLDSETVIYEYLGHMPVLESITSVSRGIMLFLDRTALNSQTRGRFYYNVIILLFENIKN
jgi:hypothetical protein